ncbi:MAG: hypothetical protein AMQ74_01990 [Candidatus Methanofastidiosum methylothiophilum]|uniref:SpoVT-AbrB domain-containing protein n=1 Tax=Candidatus Methanofastidiosum methylothiophilum TaxID=1705564 RepID=A0A150IH45_9EURY|nr:MAG: hypothetical protein AMQ74_01990 [Candidatus Methanofastidiosum methylthiophilus]
MTKKLIYNMAGYKTKLTEAGEEGLSLRTTVPSMIRKQLELKKGDFLEWNLDKVDGEWIVFVKPLKSE